MKKNPVFLQPLLPATTHLLTHTCISPAGCTCWISHLLNKQHPGLTLICIDFSTKELWFINSYHHQKSSSVWKWLFSLPTCKHLSPDMFSTQIWGLSPYKCYNKYIDLLFDFPMGMRKRKWKLFVCDLCQKDFQVIFELFQVGLGVCQGSSSWDGVTHHLGGRQKVPFPLPLRIHIYGKVVWVYLWWPIGIRHGLVRHVSS